MKFLKTSHDDPYSSTPDGKPVVVERLGLVVSLQTRHYEPDKWGNPQRDDQGRSSVDTVTAVMLDNGRSETFDADQVEQIDQADNRTASPSSTPSGSSSSSSSTAKPAA